MKESFSLLIRKEEGVDDPIIEKGMSFLTIDLKQTTILLK
jgi:hypothetical protein